MSVGAYGRTQIGRHVNLGNSIGTRKKDGHPQFLKRGCALALQYSENATTLQ